MLTRLWVKGPVLVAVGALVVAACGTSTDTDVNVVEIDEDWLEPAISIWINQVGLNQTDPEVWRNRLGLACNDGVWNEDVARRLAIQFIAADLALPGRAANLPDPTAGDGAHALWLMAVQVCRDEFPPGAIDQGPPTP